MIQEQFLIIGNSEFNYLYNHWQYSYSYEANHIAAHDILCVSTLKDVRVFDEIIYADFECNDFVTSVSINYFNPFRVNIVTPGVPSSRYILSHTVLNSILSRYAQWNGFSSDVFELYESVLKRCIEMRICSCYLNHKGDISRCLMLLFMTVENKRMLYNDIMKHADPNFGVLICRITSEIGEIEDTLPEMSRADTIKFYSDMFHKVNRKFPKYNLFFDNDEKLSKLCSDAISDEPDKEADAEEDTEEEKENKRRYFAISPNRFYTGYDLKLSCKTISNDTKIILGKWFDFCHYNETSVTGIPYTTQDDDDDITYDDSSVSIQDNKVDSNNKISNILLHIAMDKNAFKSIRMFFKAETDSIHDELKLRRSLLYKFIQYIQDTLSIISSMDKSVKYRIPDGKTAKPILKQCSYIHENVISDDMLKCIPDNEIMPYGGILPWYIECFRIKTKYQMKYYGSKFHHCLGNLTERKSMFFRWNTVCAEVPYSDFTHFITNDNDSVVSIVSQCYDKFDTITDDSKKFENFLNNAIFRFKTKDTPYPLESRVVLDTGCKLCENTESNETCHKKYKKYSSNESNEECMKDGIETTYIILRSKPGKEA